jgi:hypothetical protein
MDGPTRFAAAVGSTILLLAVGPTAGDQMRGCVNASGGLRIIGASESCRGNESFVAWNMTGPAGPQGAQGVAGPMGATGPQGPRGLPGDRGANGAPGPQGERGLVGPQGGAGSSGQQGPAGAKGDRGDVGPQGPPGAPGAQGPSGASSLNTVMARSLLTFVLPRGNPASTIDVTCPANHIAVSGAHYFGNYDVAAPPVVLASYRTELDSWQMVIYNPSTTITVGVQIAAYCAPMSN